MKAPLNTREVRQISAVIADKTPESSAPSPFSTSQTGPHERLPGQEAVPSAHTQAQDPHTEVFRLPPLHRKVRFKEMHEKPERSNCFVELTLPVSFQVVHHQRPVCSQRPVSLLWQVLPDAALWCWRQQAGRLPGLSIRGCWRIQLTNAMFALNCSDIWLMLYNTAQYCLYFTKKWPSGCFL